MQQKKHCKQTWKDQPIAEIQRREKHDFKSAAIYSGVKEDLLLINKCVVVCYYLKHFEFIFHSQLNEDQNGKKTNR